LFTFVALYANPNDAGAFEDYYRNTHMEILRRWPAVVSSSLTVFSGTPRGGDAPFTLKGEVHFTSRDDFMAAMGSDAGAQSQQDARTMVEKFGVELTMMLGDTESD
jgi:uncharacterized protein (TIGR02118 family)